MATFQGLLPRNTYEAPTSTPEVPATPQPISVSQVRQECSLGGLHGPWNDGTSTLASTSNGGASETALLVRRKRTLEDVLKETEKMPTELKLLFQPLECKLCNCKMSSNLVSSQHYEGNKHRKAIKRWVDEHKELAGDYIPPTKNRKTELDADSAYCKYCDITLSSEAVAQAHYIGKKHQDVMKKGIHKNAYLDVATGQWVRNETAKEDKSGRFGIGVAFTASSSQDTGSPTKSVGHRFFCDLCQVPCSSQTALDSHLVGAKHKKKMVAAGKPVDVGTVEQSSADAPKDNILHTVIKSESSKLSGMDLSIYRTPTGNYYCKTCDVTVNSSSQFIQHTESKKHKNKSTNKKTTQ